MNYKKVMNYKIVIHAQYEENYAYPDWNGEGKCPQGWKPKGEQLFSVMADADNVSYAPASFEKTVNKMLAKHSNDAVRFSYCDHHIQFDDEIMLDDEEFAKAFESQMEEDYEKKTAHEF